jgi:ferrous iron transport protein A
VLAGVTEVRGFPLAQAGDGEQVEIIAVDGGRTVHRRLSDLGLAPGQRVRLVAGQPGGPVLVAVGTSRIAIGFGLALKVRVIPVSGLGCGPVLGETPPNETL